jgi:AcrR family transcriptional regulator
MARPRRIEGAAETSEQILNAARIEFASRGFSTRLEDIAARCGIRRASLLHHFASKQALINAVMEQVMNKARPRLIAAAASTQGDDAATMRLVTDELRRLEAEEEGVAAVVLHALMTEPDHETLAGILEQMIDLVEALALQAGAGAHRPVADVRAALAHIIMGELGRLALGAQARRFWGDGDAVWPLIDSFFIAEKKSGVLEKTTDTHIKKHQVKKAATKKPEKMPS